ncbi:hypothetical protein V6N13_106667 [Hibiscus sabdariffa]|uniref:Uncharacterized protein n=1 Tax=Hibiscus sabdariffa TaxID=183260 RepID=A0ABR2F1F5_9ROSI
MGTAKRRFSLRLTKLEAMRRRVRKEQEGIREGQGQGQVGTKLTAINQECEQLRQETNQIIQQSAHTQLRLSLMFNILKARQQAHFHKAQHLTALLRSLLNTTSFKPL